MWAWIDPRDMKETLRAIYDETQRAAFAAVAPFTRGGKLDLSSPNIVGSPAATRLGNIAHAAIPAGDCHDAGTLAALLDDLFCRLSALEAVTGGYGLGPYGTTPYGE